MTKKPTSGLAHSLGEYETLYTYGYIQTYMEHLERIRSKDIMRVAQQYLIAANRTVGWSLPEDPEQEGQESLTAEEEDFIPPTLEVAHYIPLTPGPSPTGRGEEEGNRYDASSPRLDAKGGREQTDLMPSPLALWERGRG